MRLRIDATRTSAVVACACGWRALAGDRREALELASEHERRVHPDDRHARAMLSTWRRRHADTRAG